MLNPINKSDIRRHLDYPAIAVNRAALGGSPAQVRNYIFNMGLQTLEDRLNELDVTDEAKLTGKCIGSITLTGPDPNIGDSVSVQVSSTGLESPVTLTVTAASGDLKFGLATKLTAAAAQNGELVAAGFMPGGPFEGSAVLNPDTNPVFELECQTPFTMATSFTGRTVLFVSAQGAIGVDPQAVTSKNLGNPVITYGYIPILNLLEGAIGGVTQNADVAKAGDYVRGRELRERLQLLDFWKNRLSRFLGIPRYGRDYC